MNLPKVPRRTDIINKLTKEENELLHKAFAHVAETINAAKGLPIKVPKVWGGNVNVNERVVEAVRAQDWLVKEQTNEFILLG